MVKSSGNPPAGIDLFSCSEVYSQNLRKIRSHNKKGLSYTMGVNEFSDMTWDEFQKHRLGAAQNCSLTRTGNHNLTNAVLPDEQDWVKIGIVGEPKNQGQCGSGWAFSSTGAIEAAYGQIGMYVRLSEQQLVDCAGAFNNFGCNGGLPSQAFAYIISALVGIKAEAEYRYIETDSVCKYRVVPPGYLIRAYVNINQGAEDELKQAVAFVGPVSVAFQVVDGFQSYKSGVYTTTTCGSTPMDVNHAVLAVGYGVENGVPYWIMKNSWGPYWGDGGFFKMELGKNMCGVAACASYPIIR